MKVLRIALADSDFLALRELAHRDRRDPRSQAKVIVERAIARKRAELDATAAVPMEAPR